jgi:uncharacterized membrane protein YphA (DoxX/SURF4 family)
MRLPIRLWHVPARLTVGAYVLNSGLSKMKADEETAAGLHGAAKTAYPVVAEMQPKDFVRYLATWEIALGSMLLLPVVPSALAGGLLAGFSSALLGLYLRTPGLREPGSVRPTPQGIGFAKDVWLLGIGLSLAIDGLTDPMQPFGRTDED